MQVLHLGQAAGKATSGEAVGGGNGRRAVAAGQGDVRHGQLGSRAQGGNAV